MKTEEDFAGRQLRGTRESQDDDYGFCPLEQKLDGIEGLLLVLADGMGGYQGGAIASQLVTNAFAENFCVCRGTLGERLYSSLHASERRLQEQIANGNPTLAEMGSTLVGLVWTMEGATWVSVGDSAVYLYREGTVVRLNEYHSLAPLLDEKAARGEISPEQAAVHPDRGVLRAALTREPLGLYELRGETYQLLPGDILIAASDGLASLKHDSLVEKLVLNASEPAGRIADALLAAVDDVRKPKQDNTTVAVIKHPGPAQAPVPRRKESITRTIARPKARP